jgi:ATP-dependent RNA helicase RhlE
VTFDSFSLDSPIRRAVADSGYTIPTPIQAKAIPLVLEGRDVLGMAQTGTGKTAAFVLPILQRLSAGPRRAVRALVLSPTRELAEQTTEAIATLGAGTRIRGTSVYGGVSKQRQIDALRRGAEIVVACPGRLLDLMADRAIDLGAVEILVLDEADRMCDMGFLPDVKRILARLPAKRQTLFFSATMPPEIRSLADGMLRNPVTVQIGIAAPASTVSHALYPVPEGLRAPLLLALLETTATGRVLVFTRTKHRARSLAKTLEKHDYRVAALQGNMSQNARQGAMTGFRAGRYDILVATDIAARGIDVTGISHVINYDMPDTVDAYTHRIGRTGRAEQTGEALTLMTPADEPLVRAIERVLGERIERRRIQTFDYGQAAPPRARESQGGRRPQEPRQAPGRTHPAGVREAARRQHPSPAQSRTRSASGASREGGRGPAASPRSGSWRPSPRRARTV